MEERIRIVKAAAAIIREDIRAQPYDTSRYPTPDDLRGCGDNVIPPTLQTLVEDVVCKGRSGNMRRAKAVCRTLEEAIIAETRPRSFVSPMQVGLAVWLHRRYASRALVDVLHALGLCASYQEAVDYETSAVHHGRPAIEDSAFVQYVFDNADFNIRTLDGLGTFHAMGGVR
ncbi:uncharacterized protein LOC117651244 [Thrips palmi]|uniref:Uncharacterized protein LOC117651244 n=1 Tax=Thrips palmi TaxID=161013 RepID=A0A6P9A111_THRPL|nr:uncharacterized protein LOC117651244 [Thrips palmi]